MDLWDAFYIAKFVFFSGSLSLGFLLFLQRVRGFDFRDCGGKWRPSDDLTRRAESNLWTAGGIGIIVYISSKDVMLTTHLKANFIPL